MHERDGVNNDVENASDDDDDDNDDEYYNDAHEGSDDRSDFGDAEDAMPREENSGEDAAQRDDNVGATAGVNQPVGNTGNTLTVGTEKPGDYRLAIQLERERRETKRMEFELAREPLFTRQFKFHTFCFATGKLNVPARNLQIGLMVTR